MKSRKYERVLDIYVALSKGKIVNKSEYAGKHNVDCRTIQRDVNDILAFISDSYTMDNEIGLKVYYDHAAHGYRAA